MSTVTMSQPAVVSTVKQTTNKRTRSNSVGAPEKRRRPGVNSKQQQQSADSGGQSSDVVEGLRQEVRALNDVVAKHEKTIADLENKLHMILSAFGLQTGDHDSSSGRSPSSAGGPQQQSTTPSLAPAVTAPAAAATALAAGPSSFSDVVRRQPTTKTIRENIIAAVYVDKAASDRRASSFIVSGLPPSSTIQDQQLVEQLCVNELNITAAEITATARLGRPSASKPQPILVHVKQQSTAQQIISFAKNLRKSCNPFTRNNIYINSNLTQAESRAAYELRCRRRQAASSRDNHGSPPANQTIVISPSPALNPIAPTFQPSTSSLTPHSQ